MGDFFRFLDSVLDKGGVVATLFFVLVAAFSVAIRTLWLRNQKLHAEALDATKTLKTTIEAHSRQLQKINAEHSEKIRAMAERHEEQIRQMAEQHVKEKRVMGSRIDELQETRVGEAKSVTEKVMSYVQHIDQFVNKLEITIDVLMNAARRG